MTMPIYGIGVKWEDRWRLQFKKIARGDDYNLEGKGRGKEKKREREG